MIVDPEDQAEGHICFLPVVPFFPFCSFHRLSPRIVVTVSLKFKHLKCLRVFAGFAGFAGFAPAP